MDIPIKIKINRYKWIGNHNYKLLKSEYIEFKLFTNNYLGDECFELNEYERITIELISDIKESYMEIESLEQEEMIKLSVGEVYLLSPGGESEIGLVPGSYLFSISYLNKIYKGMYKVSPCNIDDEDLINMKEILQEICEGIIYNLFLQKSGYKNNDLGVDVFLFEQYKCLESSYKEIQNMIERIIANPITKIVNIYKLSNYSKREDIKSLRWKDKQSGRQGIKSIQFKEKRIINTEDSEENKVIKKIIENLYIFIKQVEKKYELYSEKLEARNDRIEVQRVELIKTKERLKNYRNVTRRKKEVERDINNLNDEIEKICEKNHRLNSEIKEIKFIKNNLRRYLDNSWLSYICCKNKKIAATATLLRRYEYNNLYKIYFDIFKKKSSYNNKNTFSVKKTSLLYEFYVFIIVKEIFEDLGYKWIDGWIKTEKSVSTCDLNSGESIILVDSKYKVEICYDKLINRVSDVRDSNISQLVSANTDRRRPVIIVNLFKEDKFIRSLIIEVKYRKRSAIYNKNFDTDVMNQLIAYREFDFYNAEKKRVSNNRVVDKVIAVFPSSYEKDYLEESIYGFIFIPIKPVRNFKLSRGYQYLYDEIKEFISRV